MSRRTDIEPIQEVERPHVTADPGLSRRTVVAGAAFSVPAVMMLSVSPAFAVSSGALSLSAPSMQVAASGASPVTAALRNASGAAVAGAAVSFSGPLGASFSPASATTDGSGNAVTQMDLGTPWAKPGSSVSVTAVSGSDAKSESFSVLGSNVVVAGVGYSSSLAQSERVFPSPVVNAVWSGSVSSPVTPWVVVLLADGSVWTKGSNTYGQLGDGSRTDRSTWAKVSGLSGVTQIAAGEYTGYALLSDGSVAAWGRNRSGQVGDGSTTVRAVPVVVSGLSGVTQIAAGSETAYALSGGAVKAWGSNIHGQVGDGSLTDRLAPIQVSGLSSGVTQIAAGIASGYALLSDGSVKAWGWNSYGGLGDGSSGSTSQRLSPVVVWGLSGVTQIAAGYYNGYALVSGGAVKAWGYNGDGQVGDGTTANRSTPVSVSGVSGVTQITSGAYAAYALASDGSVKAWGRNTSGQVGDGSTTNRTTPVSVGLPAGRVVQRLGSNAAASCTTAIVMKIS